MAGGCQQQMAVSIHGIAESCTSAELRGLCKFHDLFSVSAFLSVLTDSACGCVSADGNEGNFDFRKILAWIALPCIRFNNEFCLPKFQALEYVHERLVRIIISENGMC